ncbi:MAG: ABC transporter substrate binding protein [Pseudomonadota bacterium]
MFNYRINTKSIHHRWERSPKKGGRLIGPWAIIAVLLAWPVLVLIQPTPAIGGEPRLHQTTPVDNSGKPWRLGYLEGGAYNDYLPVFKSIVENLVRLGWIENPDRPCLQQACSTRQAWDCLAGPAGGRFIEFASDAYWSADWDADKRRANLDDFLARTREKKDLDLMIAMGAWAGRDLAAASHHTPTIVCSTSNAVASGIIRSPEDSGLDHVHARVDPTRYARQIRLFHEIAKFKTLGVVFEDTVEGRTYAGLDQIQPVAAAKGFQIIPCHAPFANVDQRTADETAVKCYEKLATETDAIYIAIHRGVNKGNMKKILAPLIKNRVPNFAMGTLYEVRYGAMMSMAQPDFDYAGRFYAETMAKVLNGAKPRDIGQILEDPQAICVNIEAARLVGFDFPMSILGGADEIVREIEAPE